MATIIKTTAQCDLATCKYGPWTIHIDTDGWDPCRPWQWQAYLGGNMLLEGEAISSAWAALQEAVEAIRAYEDDEDE